MEKLEKVAATAIVAVCPISPRKNRESDRVRIEQGRNVKSVFG